VAIERASGSVSEICLSSVCIIWEFSWFRRCHTNEEDGKTLRRYWTTACQACALKSKCTTGKERRISRWEHEAVLEAVQARLDRSPDKMRLRRQTVEHPFGTIKSWMGSTHFQMKRLKKAPKWRCTFWPTT
jgi:hypothetical protein